MDLSVGVRWTCVKDERRSSLELRANPPATRARRATLQQSVRDFPAALRAKGVGDVVDVVAQLDFAGRGEVDALTLLDRYPRRGPRLVRLHRDRPGDGRRAGDRGAGAGG